jgi:hypothetical protein
MNGNANNGHGKNKFIVIGNANAPSSGSKREPNQWLARQAIMDPAKKNPNEKMAATSDGTIAYGVTGNVEGPIMER